MQHLIMEDWAVFELESGFPVWDGAISYVSGSSELENLNRL